MFDALTTNTIEQIRVVEELIPLHENVGNSKDSAARQGIKLYAVSSCVTRLYAIYENFVETILSDLLDAIPEISTYESLAAELKSDYRLGISHVLSKIDTERYSHLTHESVVLWYHEALTNQPKYRFVTEALIRHEQNLRLNMLETLLGRIQLTGIRAWLAHNDSVMSLYTESDSVCEQLDAELRTFVQIRNDAAHGVLDDLQGKDNLARFCELMKNLILAISSFLHKSLLLLRANAGKARKIGVVTEVFQQNGAFVAQIESSARLQKGMQIHVLGLNYCFLQQIDSIRVNDVDVDDIVAAHPAFEVGLKCAVKPKRNAMLYVDA
jgi:hypothetical protein